MWAPHKGLAITGSALDKVLTEPVSNGKFPIRRAPRPGLEGNPSIPLPGGLIS